MKSCFGQMNIEKIRNGIFTIQNMETGQHRTFRVKVQNKEASFLPGVQIVSLLTGPENENDYKSFATMNRYGIFVWKKLLGKNGEKSDFEKYARLLHSLLTLGSESPYHKRGYVILESGRCYVCGRTLTTPESIELGIGPECRNKAWR